MGIGVSKTKYLVAKALELLEKEVNADEAQESEK